jgi:hypothetical protein
MVSFGPAASSSRGATFGFLVGDSDLLVDVFSDDDAVVFSLLLAAVLVSEPQPERTTARAVAAAAKPVSADALMT